MIVLPLYRIILKKVNRKTPFFQKKKGNDLEVINLLPFFQKNKEC